jgi:hypothetical protein
MFAVGITSAPQCFSVISVVKASWRVLPSCCDDISPLHFHVLKDQELHLRSAVSSTPAHFPRPASPAAQGYK